MFAQIMPWPLANPVSAVVTILVVIAVGIVWMIIKPESKD
jgi:hypothetical protein